MNNSIELLKQCEQQKKLIESNENNEIKNMKVKELIQDSKNILEKFFYECYLSELNCSGSLDKKEFIKCLSSLDRMYYMEDGIKNASEFISKTGNYFQLGQILSVIVKKPNKPTQVKLSELRKNNLY